MVVTTADASQEAHGGLRPMDPTRDLGAIAGLIADAFADEMDHHGRAALREMRWMARLSPLVWWWAQADPTFGDAFNGFIWEEPRPKGRGSQIVGNASLSRAPGSRHRWIICNVVVRADYRRQGIGRQLVDAAMARARSLRAVGVLLQVYQDNDTALRLYLTRGFQEATGETDLRLGRIQPAAVVEAPGYQIQAWRPSDGQEVYDLAMRVTPPELQWIRPIHAGEYRADWWSRLGQTLSNLLGGRRTYRLSVRKDRELVATLTVTASFRHGEHQLALLVHPDHAGPLEDALISRALHMLDAIPSRPVRITANKEHTTLLEVLDRYGFEKQRTLLTLWKNF
jgi:ribosomal protein S18 acetylase RimI-like enzyme